MLRGMIGVAPRNSPSGRENRSRTGLGAGAPVLLLLAFFASACEKRAVVLGFWFEDVAFQSPMLAVALTAADLREIETVAREELAIAFRELDVTLIDRPDARYRVRVAQTLVEQRTRRHAVVAGESRGVPWMGGFGSVNFTYFASGALVYAPPGATRGDLIAAIGRGIGRGAVHEFTHQMIREPRVHHSRDRGSYEYYAASRIEQYYGPMHWDTAGAVLKRKYGRPAFRASR
jgi:hypothetical protein